MARYLYLHGFGSSPRSAKGQALRAAFAARGAELLVPDLNAPCGFGKLTYTSALRGIEEASGGASSVRLIGSSMGGYLAARWAQLNPHRAHSLLLLCPGFDLSSRWERLLGAQVMSSWLRNGWRQVVDEEGVSHKLWYEFFRDHQLAHPRYPGASDALVHSVAPWLAETCGSARSPHCTLPPVVPWPRTLIIHGDRDEVVPHRHSVAFAAAHNLCARAHHFAEVADDAATRGGGAALEAAPFVPPVSLHTVSDGHDLTDSLPEIERMALSFFELDRA